MAIPGKITQDQFDAMSEDLRSQAYRPVDGEDGTYIADVGATDDGWAFENVTGLRNTIQSTRNERDQFKSKLSGFEGVDLDEYNRLRSRKTEIDEWKPDTDAGVQQKLEEINANWQRKYDTDVGGEREARTAAEKRLLRTTCTTAGTSAISKHAPKGVKALLPHVVPHLGVFVENGEDVVYVVDADGSPRITQQAGKTGNMLPEELVLSMKNDEDFMGLFPGSGAAGSGHTGSVGSPGSSRPTIDPKLSPVEKMRALRRMGGA